MIKTKIFIDLDGTLFNTAEVKQEMFALLGKIGFSMEQILKSYSQGYEEKGFTIKDFLHRLNEIKNFDFFKTERKILSIFKKIGLYNDSLDFLKKINHNNYEVNLLTFGNPAHQKYKVKVSTIEKYFDNLYFTQELKTQFLKKLVDENTKFILIDDMMEVVLDIAQAFPKAKVYLIIRSEEDENASLGKNIKIIKDLSNISGD